MGEYRIFKESSSGIVESDGKNSTRLRPFPKFMFDGRRCANCIFDSMTKDYPDNRFILGSENIEILLDGTMNLINGIIDGAKDGSSFDFMIFMDKSARNGAFVLRTLWSELDKRKEIPDGIHMPEIKFLNIGRRDDRKHNSESALTLLKLKYKDIFDGKKVALVDDYIGSGNSMRLGIKTIRDVFNPKEVTGIHQFNYLSPWYFDDQIKGVEDIGILHDIETTFLKLDSASPSQITSLHRMMSNHERDEENKLTTENSNLFKSLGINPEEYRFVWDYIHTAGGFITVPFEDKLNREYRNFLKEIVVRSLNYRDKSR